MEYITKATEFADYIQKIGTKFENHHYKSILSIDSVRGDGKMYVPQGIKEMSNILSRSNNFMVYYDPDIDGALSGELSTRVLKKFGKPYVYMINEDRQHGFKLTDGQLEKLKGYTILLVDSAITVSDLERVVRAGINIINLDHHHRDENYLVHIKHGEYEGLIINNNYSFEPQDYAFLSGAGVVYYAFKAMFPEVYGIEEEAIVGLSLLSDIRPLDTQQAKLFLHALYNTETPYIQYLINVVKPERDFGFGEVVFDRNFADFVFSPKINALFRLNKGYEAIDIFAGRWVGKSSTLEVYKNIQNHLTGEIIDSLVGYESNHLICKSVPYNIPLSYGYNVTNFIGLACSRVKNIGKTTVLFVRDEQGQVLRGSLRGNCDDVDYLAILRSFGIECEGHKNAFGILHMDITQIDLDAVSQAIAYAEHGYEERKYTGRIVNVTNLGFFLNGKHCTDIAHHNNYCRDNERIYIQYTGGNSEKEKKGKLIEYKVDGVPVKCFDEKLSLENDLILPIIERRRYKTLVLKAY